MCPAEYNCTCRPVGRAVTRRTHFRHRQLANEQRTKFSLPSLDIGSRFFEAVSNTEVSRHTQLFEEYLTQPLYETPEANFRNAVHSSTRITFVSDFEGVRHVLHVGDFTPPAQHLREHFASREVQYTLSQSQSEGSRRRRGATAPNHFMDLNLPEASISVAASQTVDGRYESDAGEVRTLHMRAGSDSGEEDILACTSGPTFRASSRERFLSFRAENKEWIEFGIEFSLNKAAMKRILQIIEAPYKVWETVERNIKKYGPLSTVKFSICNRHMLLGPYLEIGGTCKKYSPSDCVICKGNPSTFDIDTFEYIPLKNRLRNWLKSEKSCKLLYEYRKRIVTERSTEHGNYYGDIVDGSLYKRIIESRGGEEAAKYDIFFIVYRWLPNVWEQIVRHLAYHCSSTQFATIMSVPHEEYYPVRFC